LKSEPGGKNLTGDRAVVHKKQQAWAGGGKSPLGKNGRPTEDSERLSV